MTTVQSHSSADSARVRVQFDGVLFFPVTSFDAEGRVAEDVLFSHVAGGVEHRAGGVFIACGTGEFHSLGPDDYEATVRVGVKATAGRVPVFAGIGGSIGQARQLIEIAERAGVDGFLILPPYLIRGTQDGIARYFEELAAHTSLPVIAYHRGQASLTVPVVERLCAIPNLAGIKDGVGDVALAQQFVAVARQMGRTDIQFFNGLLTAEASQAAYKAIGVPLYSSAAFAMAPDIANSFYRAYREDDLDTQRQLLDGFYTPFIALRDSTPGFAVSLVKAGLRLAGFEVGGVRPPLSDPTEVQLEELAAILAQGRKLVGDGVADSVPRSPTGDGVQS